MPDGSQFVSISGRLTGNVEKKKKRNKNFSVIEEKICTVLENLLGNDQQ